VQLFPEFLHINTSCIYILLQRLHSSKSGCLAHAHCLCHRTTRCMCIMSCGKTPSYHPGMRTFLRNDCTIRHPICTVVDDIFPIRLVFAVFSFAMIFNRSST